MNFKIKNQRLIFALICLILGGAITCWTYFSTNIYHKEDIAVIMPDKFEDRLIHKDTDIYQNKDQTRQQTFYIKMLSGKHKGRVYKVINHYYPSQLTTQKYRIHNRVLAKISKNKAVVLSPKRDWIPIMVLTITLSLMIILAGKHTIALLISMILSWAIFFGLMFWDLKTNSNLSILIYGLADIIFSFICLIIVQGYNKKMLVTWLATLIGIFSSFILCYLIMQLTGNTQMRYDTSDFITQDPQGIFLAQTLLGILGAVLDEATDIVSSLHELIIHKPNITKQELINSGRNMGKEITGPLINVLLLIFIASALPETILYLRDNAGLGNTFNYTLAIGLTQSVISGIGIVLTVVSATGASLLFLKQKDRS
ncbi:putative membrane protein [Lactobacillus colini]|uniref:Membrane protein n=1 Tax=Lactobacillus colini TaxID=1819254 RepID=A0ABS4MFY4_9LACO|nr:YibE/F family protein [Lactobacillus colini]MBP2058277.1 putative membrane protein [Lactobacillus colini]